MLILAHVTHEAVDKLGGIGAVLDGLVTTPAYQKTVGRTLLVGPLFAREGDPKTRLGRKGRVLYSSLDRYDSGGWAGRFRPIELAFNVGIVYGRRTIEDPITLDSVEVEALLLDISEINPARVNAFKARLFTRFDLHSMPHEGIWDFEQYTRIAEPGYYAIQALMHSPEDQVVVISHEYMGVPLALATVMEGDKRFATMYHAHETPVIRKIVEEHPGHDTGFYNVLAHAERHGLTLDQTYGPQSYFKHALVQQARHLGVVMAVGDTVEREFRFIDKRFDEKQVRLAFNGIPARRATVAEIMASKKLLKDYTSAMLGFRPDFVMTHVTRPVISKGLWRDMLVAHHLEPLLAAEGKTAVFYILTSGGGTRREHDVQRMEAEYGWPVNHRDGYPDLVGPEIGIAEECFKFNRRHAAIKAVLVNQFGWNREACGLRMPAEMSFLDLRRGADVEMGQSIYEPFGISQLEALCFGAVCVVSSACGCLGLYRAAAGGKSHDNVLVTDYVTLDEPAEHLDLARLMRIGQAERDKVEVRVAGNAARELFRRLPRDEKSLAKLLETGYALASKMDWAAVFRDYFHPAMKQAQARAGVAAR